MGDSYMRAPRGASSRISRRRRRYSSGSLRHDISFRCSTNYRSRSFISDTCPALDLHARDVPLFPPDEKQLIKGHQVQGEVALRGMMRCSRRGVAMTSRPDRGLALNPDSRLQFQFQVKTPLFLCSLCRASCSLTSAEGSIRTDKMTWEPFFTSGSRRPSFAERSFAA